MVIRTLLVGVLVTSFASAVGSCAARALTPLPAPHALEAGEFYMMGDFRHPGVYPLHGKAVTLKQALNAAGFDHVVVVAPMKTVELIRLQDDNSQSITRLKLTDLLTGEQADRVLQPNDVIMLNHETYAPARSNR